MERMEQALGLCVLFSRRKSGKGAEILQKNL